MTQFPPSPPAAGPQSYHSAARPPYCMSAIAGFVLSLLGCLGPTALLGLVFGIVGISRTRDGRMRGRGLAIAAIPISVVNGILSIFVILGVFAAVSFLTMTTGLTRDLPTVLAGDPAKFAASTDALKTIGSDEFNEAVGADRIRAWLAKVAETHGKLIDAGTMTAALSNGQSNPPDVIRLRGNFAKGKVDITVKVDVADLRHMRPLKIVDITVGDLSLRDSTP